MAQTLWYENTKNGLQWEVTVGSEVQLRLAEDPNYRQLAHSPVPAPVQSSPNTPTSSHPEPAKVVVSSSQSSKR